MGNHTQNKIPMDVAADSSSLDSLSFTGLLCIQDQLSQSPGRKAYQDSTEDQEFEFVSVTLGKSPHYSKENSHPDMLNPNSHHLPLELWLKSAQSEAANKPGYKKSPSPSLGNHANQPKVLHKSTEEEAKNQVKRKQAASRSWFGQKLFQSFVSPCRECHAVRPTTKAHAA